MIIYTWLDLIIQKLVDMTLLFGVNIQMIVICDTSFDFPLEKCANVQVADLSNWW